MSIATQITRLNNNINSMKTTKQEIKDAVNNDFDIIANEQIEDYAELIEEGLELYKDCIPSIETNQATEITVTDAMKYSRNKLELFGNTEQASTSIASGDEYDSPSPEHPQDIHVVTGENTIEQYSKNLLYFPYSEYNWDGTSYINGSKIVIEGSAAIISSIRLASKYNINIAQNTTVTFSARIVDGKGFYEKNWAQVGFNIYYDDGSEEKHFVAFHSPAYKDEILSLTITTSKKVVAIAPFWGSSSIGESGNFIIFGIQMEIGRNATEYMDGKTIQTYPINLGSLELCKIGDYQDEIFKNEPNNQYYDSSLVENGWYKNEIIGQINLNLYTPEKIDSGWGITPFDGRSVFMYYGFGQVKHNGCYTSWLKYYPYDGGFRWKNIVGISDGGGYENFFIRVPNSIATNVTEFRNYLEEHPLNVKYTRHTNTKIQITDETLIAQLDAIYEHLQLSKGTNHITVTASDLKPYMKLSYKSLENEVIV